MLKKGFTLIELLIVITIIAVLAGSAVPYVQDYVEDARLAKVRADLNEIKMALIRFELDRGVPYDDTTIAALVGPYLDKAIADPWGTPYAVASESSVAFSYGQDRSSDYVANVGGTLVGTADDVSVDYRPPLALSKAFWIDVDKNGAVSDGDEIRVRFTRGALAANVNLLDQTHWTITVNGIPETAGAIVTAVGATSKDAVITLTTVAAGTGVFIPGRDTLNFSGGAGDLQDEALLPFGPNDSAQNLVVIKAL